MVKQIMLKLYKKPVLKLNRRVKLKYITLTYKAGRKAIFFIDQIVAIRDNRLSDDALSKDVTAQLNDHLDSKIMADRDVIKEKLINELKQLQVETPTMIYTTNGDADGPVIETFEEILKLLTLH